MKILFSHSFLRGLGSDLASAELCEGVRKSLLNNWRLSRTGAESGTVRVTPTVPAGTTRRGCAFSASGEFKKLLSLIPSTPKRLQFEILPENTVKL